MGWETLVKTDDQTLDVGDKHTVQTKISFNYLRAQQVGPAANFNKLPKSFYALRVIALQTEHFYYLCKTERKSLTNNDIPFLL